MRPYARRANFEEALDSFSQLICHSFFRHREVLCSFSESVPEIENVFSGKLAVRILVDIAIGLHTIAIGKYFRRLRSEDLLQLWSGPNVESSFALLVRMRGIDDAI